MQNSGFDYHKLVAGARNNDGGMNDDSYLEEVKEESYHKHVLTPGFDDNFGNQFNQHRIYNGSSIGQTTGNLLGNLDFLDGLDAVSQSEVSNNSPKAQKKMRIIEFDEQSCD